MGNTTYNTFGTITKKEQLASVENETNSSFMVLENLKPYPGYHGTTVPDSLEPDSLFAITKVLLREDAIMRTIQKVKKGFTFDFDAAPAELEIQNELRSAIRFKGLKYVLVGEVLEAFAKDGIEFRKTRKVNSFETLIMVKKFFNFEQISDNVFKDQDDPNINYFTVPSPLRWDIFEEMTINCKYNIEDKNFDAALATVYMNNGIYDLVRIYDSSANIDKLCDIRRRYLQALEKM